MSEPPFPGPEGAGADAAEANAAEILAAAGRVEEGLRRVRADALAYAEARWRLMQLELLEARAALGRLAAVALASFVLAVVGLGLLAASGAERLSRISGLDRALVLAMEGGLLLAAGAGAAWWGWRRWRRTFRPLEQSLEELQEDLHWLRERWGLERR
jgi:uncharacterized membrane protein YqjE